MLTGHLVRKGHRTRQETEKLIIELLRDHPEGLTRQEIAHHLQRTTSVSLFAKVESMEERQLLMTAEATEARIIYRLAPELFTREYKLRSFNGNIFTVACPSCGKRRRLKRVSADLWWFSCKACQKWHVWERGELERFVRGA